jgi:nitroreductase
VRIRILTPAQFARMAVVVAILALISPAVALCQQSPIQLSAPQMTGGMPLLQALAQRQTTRAFADKPLPLQTLSNLLWAAFGVNRPHAQEAGPGRTAPSALNRQEIELYVLLADGVYLYQAGQNRLRPVVAKDLRSKANPAAARAAVTIAYVADADRVADGNLDFARVDTGFIAQNVYLFAASEGLNAWFYTFHGHEADIAKELMLPEGKKPIYAQSIGFQPR